LPEAQARGNRRFDVDAGGAMGIGLLPDVSFGVTALASLRPRLRGPRVSLSFTLWPEQRSAIDASHGVTSRLMVAGLGVCPLEGRWTSRVAAGCFFVEAAQLQASGSGFPVQQRQSGWVADLSAGGELRQLFADGLFGAVGARALVPVVRAHIGYMAADGQVHNVFTTWPVSVVAELRLGYSF